MNFSETEHSAFLTLLIFWKLNSSKALMNFSGTKSKFMGTKYLAFKNLMIFFNTFFFTNLTLNKISGTKFSFLIIFGN